MKGLLQQIEEAGQKVTYDSTLTVEKMEKLIEEMSLKNAEKHDTEYIEVPLYIEHRYRWSPTKPSFTDKWYDSPGDMLNLSGDKLWGIRRTCHAFGSFGNWSEPVVMDLKDGDTLKYANSVPHDKPIDMIEDDWREYIENNVGTTTLTYNKLFDAPSAITDTPLESHKMYFIDDEQEEDFLRD